MVRTKQLNLAILSLALVARIGVFLLASRGFFMLGEGVVQADLAENILSGRGLMISESLLHSSDPRRDAALEFYREAGGLYGAMIPEQPSSFLVPGYPIFVAGIYALTSPGNHLAVIAFQLVLGVLTVFLGLRLASRFLSGFWYAAAGVFMAIDPFELYYEAIPATQAFFSLLFVLSLLLSLRFLENRDLGSAVSAGLVWGLTFLVRPAALPMVLWLVAVYLFSGKLTSRKVYASAAVLLCFSLAVAPWVLRNRNTMGRYQLLPLQGGVQMWEYNGRIFTDHFENEQAGARTMYLPVRELWMDRLSRPELAEFPEFTDHGEFQRDSILYSRQMEFLSANPLLFLHLSTCRFAEFFKPFPLNEFSPVFTLAGLVSFAWVGIFFFAGTILLLRRGSAGVYIAGVIGGYVLMHLLTASGTPHRVGLDFPLFIASLLAVKYSFSRISSR